MSKQEIEAIVVYHNGKFVEYESKPVSEWDSAHGEKLLTHAYLMDSFRKLMGRTLTLIDASISESVQNKAMKDMVKAIFSEETGSTAEMCFNQAEMQESISEEEEFTTASIEEVLGVEE